MQIERKTSPGQEIFYDDYFHELVGKHRNFTFHVPCLRRLLVD